MSKDDKLKGTERNEDAQIDALFNRISDLIVQARRYVNTSVNVAEVRTRFEVGRYIFEYEQQGVRAEYGKQVLKKLSIRLTNRFGGDWSHDTLKRCRFFYQAYANATIGATPMPQLEMDGKMSDKEESTHLGNTDAPILLPRFTLTWSHYLVLMRIENLEARSFYEIECAQQQWSVKQLKRQVGSSLYERLALSRDKEEVMRLATEGQTVEKPSDIIKNPLTLEFLGLKPEVAYTESKLENAIIDKMQQFLLELGKGFLLSIVMSIFAIMYTYTSNQQIGEKFKDIDNAAHEIRHTAEIIRTEASNMNRRMESLQNQINTLYANRPNSNEQNNSDFNYSNSNTVQNNHTNWRSGQN